MAVGAPFFAPETSDEAPFHIQVEPTVTLLPDGTFKIEGGRWAGGSRASNLNRVIIDRARKAIEKMRAETLTLVKLDSPK